MLFRETRLPGAFVLELEHIADDRGFFARTWCAQEFAAHGLSSALVQCSVSFNRRRGTLRGMHYQAKPHEEVRLVRCTQGSILDVTVDLRPESTTYCQWVAVELSARNRRMLYIPIGFAHGFQTLEDDTEVFYQMSQHYHPESARGVRWNDPVFGIEWPIADRVMSDRDAQFPDFQP